MRKRHIEPRSNKTRRVNQEDQVEDVNGIDRREVEKDREEHIGCGCAPKKCIIMSILEYTNQGYNIVKYA